MGQLPALAPAGGAFAPAAGVVADDDGAVVDGVVVAAYAAAPPPTTAPVSAKATAALRNRDFMMNHLPRTR